MEKWIEWSEYPSIKVSNLGNVKTKRKGVRVDTFVDNKGVKRIRVHGAGRNYHRRYYYSPIYLNELGLVVLDSFRPFMEWCSKNFPWGIDNEHPDYAQGNVVYIDGDPTNAELSNLRWRIPRRSSDSVERIPRWVLSEDEALNRLKDLTQEILDLRAAIEFNLLERSAGALVGKSNKILRIAKFVEHVWERKVTLPKYGMQRYLAQWKEVMTSLDYADPIIAGEIGVIIDYWIECKLVLNEIQRVIREKERGSKQTRGDKKN